MLSGRMARLLFLVVVLPWCPRLAAQLPGGYRFTYFDPPGAQTSTAAGINDRGDIVGETAGVGYVRTSAGVFTTFTVPGATSVYPNAINNNGQIAGGFTDSSGGRPFLREADGSVSSLAIVINGSPAYTILGINDSRQTLACAGLFCVLRDPGGASWDVPPLPFRTIHGVNNSGQVVGTYGYRLGPGYPFLSKAEVMPLLNQAAGSRFIQFSGGTTGRAISNSGQAAGMDSSLGYVWDPSGAVTFVHVPKASFSVAGLNSGGRIVGSYSDGGAVHSYLGAPCATGVNANARPHGNGVETGTVSVAADPDCYWAAGVASAEGVSWAAGAAPGVWVTILGSPRGSGPGTVTYRVEANTSSTTSRTARLSVAGNMITITQAGGGCDSSILSSMSASLPAGGGEGRFTVTLPQGCPAAATSSADWLRVQAVAGQTGGYSVGWSVGPNYGAADRTAAIATAGKAFTVTQAGGGGACVYFVTPVTGVFAAGGGTAAVRVATGPGCAWSASSGMNWIRVSGGGSGPGSVTYTVDPLNGAGPRNGLLTVAGTAVIVNQMSAAAPVSVGPLYPASGSGTYVMLGVPVQDAAGYQNIERVQVLINDRVSVAGSCTIHYDRRAGTLQLMNDAGTAWLGPGRPGQFSTLENSQCRVLTDGSSISAAGGRLALNLQLVFQRGFRGEKLVLAEALNSQGYGTGYRQIGEWTVLAERLSLLAASPVSGRGSQARLVFRTTQPRDAAQTRTQILIHGSLRAADGCLVYVSGASLALLNDAGNAWIGPVTAGQAGTVSNNQCILDGANSRVYGGIWDPDINHVAELALSFRPSFAGAKTVYQEALDAGGYSTGYQPVGTFAVEGPVAAPTVQVTPGASPLDATLRFQFTHAGGAGNIVRTQMLVNAALSADGGCLVYYDRGSNSIRLLNDEGTAFGAPWVLGLAGTAANSRCTIDAGASSASLEGNTLTVTLAARFSAGFASPGAPPKKIYAEQYADGQTSGYFEIGGYAAVQPAPAVVGVTPGSGSGSSQTFRFDFEEAAGAGYLARAQVLFNATLSGPGGCLVYYAANGAALLLNDAGTGWLGPAALGAGTLRNSQCTVNLAQSSASMAGTRLSLTLAVSFEGGFRGLKQVFAETLNLAGSSTGYRAVGTWTVP